MTVTDKFLEYCIKFKLLGCLIVWVTRCDDAGIIILLFIYIYLFIVRRNVEL